MERRSESGQVGVETALVMPLTVFLILGIIQLSMMQQTRLLTEYAAFRAVRAGAVDQIDCKKMNTAAIEALLPSIGRTDSATQLLATFAGGRRGGSEAGTLVGAPTSLPFKNWALLTLPTLHVVDISYVVKESNSAPKAPYTAQDFDDPDHPITLVDNVIYNYQLTIPFADMLIYQIWTGTEFLMGSADVLMPANNGQTNLVTSGTMIQRAQSFNADPAKKQRMESVAAAAAFSKYFVPIRASYSMRMMSNIPKTDSCGNSVAVDSPVDCCSTTMTFP
ncbi:MAG: TadE/TadG family type IV pilus assembly protein [Myxococcales bacterium]